MADDKYPKILIRVSVYEKRLFDKFKREHGLSARDILELSGCPCPNCKNTVTAYDKLDGEPFEIPKGILKRK